MLSLLFSRKVAYFLTLAIFFFVRKQTLSQPAITCSKLTIETLEQGVKYVQS